MNKNMIGKMAVIAAITLATTAIVMSLTQQQAFADSSAVAIGAEAANQATVTQSASNECTSTSAGPLAVLSISITVCKSELPPQSSTIDQTADATNSGAVTATATDAAK